MSEGIIKHRKIVSRIIPEVKLAQEVGRGITKVTGLEEPFQSNVDTRREAKESQKRQSNLIKKAKQTEELRLAQATSDVARRKPTNINRRTLLG